MKHAKKLLALLLALALALALAVPAFAEDTQDAQDDCSPTFWQKIWVNIVLYWSYIKWILGFGPNPLGPVLYKPVIYLYPEQPTEIAVTVQTIDAHFIETIPDYNNGWRVLAQPDGTLTNLADGAEYPYLFWEAKLETPWPKLTEGFIVARDDLPAFLDEKLRFLGLNDAEAGEFIEYWLPYLAVNAYNLIHFSGEYYDARFPLGITPAPDSLLRVFMVARAAKANERIAPQALVPFERSGFAAIEWGGMML